MPPMFRMHSNSRRLPPAAVAVCGACRGQVQTEPCLPGAQGSSASLSRTLSLARPENLRCWSPTHLRPRRSTVSMLDLHVGNTSARFSVSRGTEASSNSPAVGPMHGCCCCVISANMPLRTTEDNEPSPHPSDHVLHEYCHGADEHIATIEAHLSGCGECTYKISKIIRETIQAERRSIRE